MCQTLFEAKGIQYWTSCLMEVSLVEEGKEETMEMCKCVMCNLPDVLWAVTEQGRGVWWTCCTPLLKNWEQVSALPTGLMLVRGRSAGGSCPLQHQAPVLLQGQLHAAPESEWGQALGVIQGMFFTALVIWWRSLLGQHFVRPLNQGVSVIPSSIWGTGLKPWAAGHLSAISLIRSSGLPQWNLLTEITERTYNH